MWLAFLIGIILIVFGVMRARHYSYVQKEMRKKNRWDMAEHCGKKVLTSIGMVVLGVFFLCVGAQM